MGVVVVVLVPVLFLTLAASMVVVGQLSSFFQFNKYSRKRQTDRQEIMRFMTQLATAQSQVFQRSRELEGLSARLQVNNQELARLNSMKSKFLSMVVHDMRTPLASIKGFGEMLSRQKLEPTQTKYVDYIVRGTDQMNRLMADLTDLAVIEAGKLKMDKQPFDISSMLNDIVPAIGVIAQKKGVLFVAPEIAPDSTVVGDRFRLVQALMNFLNNAVKFTPAGGKVELLVSVSLRTATFKVKDSGPGIHPSERKSVFEKFYQSQFMDQKSRKQGWGLGLSIAQEIVKSHFGEIGVDSAGLGKGATFWYRIPLKPPKFPALARAGAAALLLLLLPFGGRALAQQPQTALPIEEKARYEKALQEKAESVLLHLLGPSRARVVVDATLDFTRIERFDVKSGAVSPEDKNILFLWQNVGAQVSGPELLPGVPTQDAMAGPSQTRSYERQNSFPSAFVKRLNVILILDRTVDVKQGDELSKIVSDVLDVQPERGDALTVVRAPFAPAWRTIWYTPEAASLLFKYGLISLMTLITLVVVAACFLKLAEAMDSMAQAQAHQLQMDFGGQGQPAAEEEEEEKKEEGPVEAAVAQTKIVFNVRPEQVDTLNVLLRGQDAENIALVTAHLPPDTKKAFLAKLPPSVYGTVLAQLGRVRFVDQEMVATIKEELERRLESAIGGSANLFDMLESSTLPEKRELLKLLEAQDPELARQVRAKILLFEDISDIEEKDWSLVLSSVTLEEWAFALYDAPEELVTALKAQMLPKTWSILSQLMQVGRPSEAAVEKAHERIVAAVAKLVADGRITNPVSRHIEMLAERPKEEAPPPLMEGAGQLG
ncbi:MAG: ATP-binding protein [Elusimicrobiota bacterium]|jgi:signal transduction histidine kinase